MTHTIGYQGSELELFAAAHNWRAYWSSMVKPFLGQRVLEVGAGIGSITRLFPGQAAEWIALEPDQEQAMRINSWIAAEQIQNTKVINGILADVPADDKFNSILYIDVLEHIKHDNEEILDAYSRLIPGGHLVILVPAHQSLYTSFDRAIGHFRRYNHQQLERLRPSGSVVRLSAYLDCVGLMASLTNKLLLRASMPTADQIMFWDQLLVPISKRLDKIARFGIGKSLLVVWMKPA